ncbi:MAG: hypothetical protein A0129_14940 [Limnobacter sp. CACIAM 66H1]|uniref:hypothetical protein n=1 Tax=Limnobacter sp. CACIAM 66H1 TaxID=1813033 RepID=UPI0007A80CAC|nr:hypothetical protein [Limnobacter sp. CACIAM 66H1]KYP10066.1 MAG: hypothetical protein A0129_14940 [Limnobacter sp. CACIAM 66H1]
MNVNFLLCLSTVCYLFKAITIESHMTHRLLIHAALLFALLFQSLAHALPCCAEMDALQSETTPAAIMDEMAQHVEEGCFAGSPVCCVVPSLAYEAVILDSQGVSPVHVPSVKTLLLSQLQIPLDRPPRA